MEAVENTQERGLNMEGIDVISDTDRRRQTKLLEDRYLPLICQGKRAFLLGAGCSVTAGIPTMRELSNSVLASIPKGKGKGVMSALQGCYAESNSCTIEDYMSEIVDYIAITERREGQGGDQHKVKIGRQPVTGEVLRSLLSVIKNGIFSKIADCAAKENLETHRKFVRSVRDIGDHGKSLSARPVDYFTLNYDLLIEDALAYEEIPYADGMRGGALGWWDADTYTQSCTARVIKLHGSIDWMSAATEPFPRRVRVQPSIPCPPGQERMIWPAATKYREAQHDPYATQIGLFHAILHDTSVDAGTVLTIIGYSFGDEHINAEIESALCENEHLTVAAFTSQDPLPPVLLNWRTAAFKKQVYAYSPKEMMCGDGDSSNAVSNQTFDWWKFEAIADFLEGRR
jgi:hypothetical protein